MNTLISLLLLSMSASAWSSEGWKTIAETGKCEDKVRIQAKAGEKFVYALTGDKKIKLLSEDGTAYKKDSPTRITFSNAAEKSRDSKITFILPAFIENNSPKVQIMKNDLSINCSLTYK